MSKTRGTAADHDRAERAATGGTGFSLLSSAKSQQEECAAGGRSTIPDQLAREATGGYLAPRVAEFATRVVQSGGLARFYGTPIPQPLLDREPYVSMAADFYRWALGHSDPMPQMNVIELEPPQRAVPHAGHQVIADDGRQK